MASLLRSSKILRVVPGLLRTLQGQSSALGSSAGRQTLRSSVSSVRENVRLASTTTAVTQSSYSTQAQSRIGPAAKADNEFRTVLRRLDDMVRRTGRITKNQLMLVFDEVCKMGTASPNQALLLLRSCGSLLPEVPLSERTELVHKIWDRLASMGVTYDVSHYNALLKVYLQNEYNFSPTEFLAKMESKSVEPNRVTYQRLISAYCLLGDIPGATKILEFMKIKELPVTEGVFNSLITGHARAGDMENARNILDVMRNVGLEPSQDTYSALMCALAEKGDIEGIEEVIQEAESQVGEIADRYYLSVAYSLATSGHEQHLPKILERIRLGVGFIPDTINLSLSLITQGQIEAAFSVLKLFSLRQVATIPSTEPPSQGSFFIDTLVQLGTPHETLFHYLDTMISEGLHATPYIVALHVALRNQGSVVTHEYILGITKRMIELDIPVRPHYFWPMMTTEANRGNSEGVLQLAKAMADMGIQLNMETYSKYLIPAVGDKAEVVLARLKDLGMSVDKQVIAALCRHEVSKNRLDIVVQFLDSYPDLVEVSLFRTALINSFHRFPQVEPLVTLLTNMWTQFKEDQNLEVNKQDYIGGVLYDMVRAIPDSKAVSLKPHLQLLFDKLADQGIHIAMQRFRGIRNVLDEIKLMMVKPNAYRLLDPAEVNANPMGNIDLLANSDISVDQLEAHLTELKEKGANCRGILRRLILYHTANNNYQRSVELIEEFKARGYELTGAIYASLMSVCSNHQRYDEAFQFKKELEQADPLFRLDMSKYRPLICHLAKSNKMEDALALVEEMKKRDIGTDRQEKQLFHLLNELAQEGLTGQTQQIFDKLVSLGLIRVNSNILGPVVMAHIVRKDIAGALQCIQDCQTKYGLMPHFHEILVKLVEDGDTEQLQKAMDFTSHHHGDINMLYDLIFAFLSTGKFKEAKKIFETPGMVARDRRLQWYAEQCISKNQTEALENLVAMTRDLYGCDRDNIHFQLLQLYTRQKDPDKCLQVWTTMQDEGVVPKDRTLRYLANVLRSYKRPVPFEVPQITLDELPESSSVDEDPVSNLQNRIIAIAKSGNLEGATRLLEEARSKGTELKMPAYDVLMWENLKQKNLEGFSKVKDMCKDFEDFSLGKNLRNKMIVEYLQVGDEEAAHQVYDEQIQDGIAPLRSGMRLLASYYEEKGDLDKLKEMKAKYEEKTGENFPMAKCILGAYIQRGDVSGAVSFIEQELEKDSAQMRRIGLRSFLAKLILKEADMTEVLEMVDRLNARDMDGAVWQLIFAHLDCNQVEQARAMAEKYPVIREKSSGLIGYIIAMFGRDSDMITKINNVLEMTEGKDYLDKSTIYFYLFKAYDQANEWEAASKLREKMIAENLPITDFNLKRLAMLLQRNNQPVPFEEPPNSISHYRDLSRLEHKDNLTEIEELTPDEEDGRQAHNSTD
ncbi:leucine-rich PPR motif-containing protein, mitochondrial-like [Acanthaster planci]|uniref:Leucine-rich PPR motif-containing protein, mitochondrial-like n=1 Tax=Acanthaster planci TaxID=133434 RepID=A0A8B7YX72_ACAPL|nr:leucine-rich PPR motif-containing protein, mitochondrial-like [Acanthaster planci]